MGGAGGSGGAGVGGTGGSGGAGGSGGVPSTEKILTQNIEVLQVAPGDQLTVCTTKVLDNATEVKVKGVRGYIGLGSHHFIVDRDPTDIPIDGLVPCVGLSGTDATRVLIAEKPETEFMMPEGVGFTLRPNQPLTMELHYYNPTAEVIDVEAHIDFVIAEGEEAASLKEASMVFIGNPALTLEPGVPTNIDFFMSPPGGPGAPVHVFAMTSHTHKLGVRSTITRTADALEGTGMLVHESLDWAEPPFDTYDPPLVFDGSDGLFLRCEYVNTTPDWVNFGTRVEDEMCFMWLYYYE
jgi:hypothetical protein